jgi:hypothetical protein
MLIGELDMRCGECGVIDFCSSADNYAVCTDSRFQYVDEALYAEIADKAFVKTYEPCRGCKKYNDCQGAAEDCENAEASCNDRDEQIAVHVERELLKRGYVYVEGCDVSGDYLALAA